MNKITFALGAVLFFVVTGLFVANLHEAMACPGTDSVVWEPEDADINAPSGAFAEYPWFYWNFRETPYVGSAEFYEDTPTQNIATSSYTPAYFYPTNCIGAVNVTISGTLTTGPSTGTLASKGWCWDSGSPAPYAENFIIYSITRT